MLSPVTSDLAGPAGPTIHKENVVKNFLLFVFAVVVCVLTLAPEAEARGRRGGFFRRNNCRPCAKIQIFNRTSAPKVQLFKGRTTKCSGSNCTVPGLPAVEDSPAPPAVEDAPAPVVDDAPAAAALPPTPLVPAVNTAAAALGSGTSSEDVIQDAPTPPQE